MDHPQKFIFLILAIGWTLFRLLRYLKLAASARPGAAVPPTAGDQPQRTAHTPTAPATVQSPIDTAGGNPLTHKLAAAGIVVAGNAVIWPLLFMTPALAEVPTLLRLIAGVLANLILLGFAVRAAARLARSSRPGSADDRNPIK